MKRKLLSVGLALLCLWLWMVPVGAVTQTEELHRAMSLGLISELPGDGPVTAQELFSLLDTVVARTDPDALSAFRARYPEARTSAAPLNRYDAMVAVLAAAETLGVDALNEEQWIERHTQIGETCWDHIVWNGALFGPEGYAEPALDWNRDAASYFYSFGRRSFYSGKTIFDYDPVSNSMRTDEPLTETEAVLAILRLHDTVPTNFVVTERVIGAAEQALLDQAEARKQAILESETAVSWTGQAYYVSNSGNDDQDGKTPETAWATLDRVNDTWLQPGDAVFLERGGLWRGGLWAQEGVTYSAYGEGPKPRIYGSPESGVGEEKWSLWYEADGVKIWKYHTTLQDPGGIVMNGGETCASRVYSYWNGEAAVFWDEPERAFDLVEALERVFDRSGNQYHGRVKALADAARAAGLKF